MVYPKTASATITEISNTTDSKWCSIYNIKAHDMVEYGVHLVRSRPQIKYDICGDGHFIKSSPKPNKIKT